MDRTALQRLGEFLEALNQASDLEARCAEESADPEFQRVVQQLNAFLDKLWLKDFQLAAKQEMLEKVVEIRTREVHEILDNVSSGFLIALPDETVLDNYSRSCRRIFEREELKGQKLSALMGLNERQAGHFQSCYEQVFDPVMPVELSLGQMPEEFKVGDHSYRLQGAPIYGSSGLVTKVFFTITDTTELKKAEAENALRQALLEIVRQKENFREFLFETSRAFEAHRQRPSEHGMRSLLHTTKGNLGCYGLHDLAALIHAIEDAPQLAWREVQRVEDTLKQFLVAHQDLIGITYPETTRVARSVELERLLPFLDQLQALGSEPERRRATRDFVKKLQWIPAGVLLAPLRGLAARVADRLGKEVELEFKGESVLIDPERVGAVVSSLGHLVRNCLDHGLEFPNQRGEKPRRGRVRIHCSETAQSWRFLVEDDGRGIDAEALAQAAVARGVVTAELVSTWSKAAKLDLLFQDGVSTKTEANLVSGRGVGAGAVRDTVLAAGGTLKIDSQLGRGTRFFIEIPRPRDE